MFPRVGIAIAAAACLTAAAVPARAAAPVPSVTATSTGSVNVSWTGGTAPFIAVLSTSPSFASAVSSGAATSPAAYPGLAPNTTYYFKVKSSADPDSLYSPAITTVTMAASPSGIYSLPPFFTAPSSDTAKARLGWQTGGNPEWTSYDLAYAKDAGFTSASLARVGYPPVDVGGLDANTTYYFKVRAIGIAGNITAYTSAISTSTLALDLSGIDEDVHETSATISWTPVDHPTIQALDSEGYRLKLSESLLLTSLLDDWATADSAAASRTVTALTRNTTYYYKAGSLNWPGEANLTQPRSFTTLAAAPSGFAKQAVTDGAATLLWDAMAAGEAQGYRLEASTGSFLAGETVHSSATYQLASSILSIGTLDPNTTYYFRVASLNKAGDPNYSARLSSVTLALPVSVALTQTYTDAQQLRVAFTPLPESPQAFACEGYVLEGSSTDFSGGTLFSSATYAYQEGQRSLELTGLAPNTTYYLRLSTLNWELTPNVTVLPSTRTGFPAPPSGVALEDIWSSSAAFSFGPGTAAQGHVAEASAYRAFHIIAASSATADGYATGLVITGLDPNTTYYYRVGALYNGTTIYNNATPEYRQTLPMPLTGPGFPEVYQSSVTVSWTPLSGASQPSSAERYVLEAGTDPAFGAVTASSSTENISLDRLTVTGLAPNTSYYFRAGTVNLEGSVNYTLTPATATLARAPAELAYDLTPGSIVMNWDPLDNPADTRYLAEIDDNEDFSPVLSSSLTVLSSAAFTGLGPNTTYFFRITAINRLNRSVPPARFSDIATDAYDPVPAAASGIGVSSFCVNWSSGTPPASYNLPGTYYSVKISSNPDFSGTFHSSVTLALSATFYGLVSNASYYMQASALNLTNIPTDPPVDLGSVLTLPATAYVLPAGQTFTGMMLDGFTVNWADNGNSSHTLYYVQASTDSGFGAVSSAQLVRDLSCTFSDLSIDTTYWVRLLARGQSGAESGYVLAGSTRTLFSTNQGALALQDTTVTLDTSYGPITVRIPSGSLGSSTRLTINPSTGTLPAPLSAVGALTPTGIAIEIDHFPPTLVLGALSITLPYRPADLPGGIDRSRLVLALYDEDNAVWVPLPSVSDTANDRVTAQTWHLSLFQLMQSNPSGALGAVKIYPNPYRPNTETNVMHFAGMSAYARIKIYTFLGELVRSLRADVNGMAQWDGRNDSGREAASGVYIAFVQTSDKTGSRSFKVALER